MRLDSGTTQGYLWAYDGDNSVNMGSNSNSQFNFKVNNATEAYIPTGQGGFTIQSSTGQHSWLNIIAPSGNVQEATLTTKLDHGSGNTEFVDWTTEDYGTDWQHSINIAKAGTGQLRPFSLRFWNSDLGNIAANGYYSQTWLPSGAVGFGVSTSSIPSGVGFYVGTTTANSAFAGKLGIGSTTPWGILSVASSTYDFKTPLFAVATSTHTLGNLFSIFASSTVQTLASTADVVRDIGVRIGIGTMNYLGYGGLLDHFTVKGRINTEGWNYVGLMKDGSAGLSSDTSNVGGPFQYQEDGAEPSLVSTANTTGGYGYNGLLVPNAAADNGAGFFAVPISGGSGWFVPATSTPVMEISARITNPQNATGTTAYYMGFTNLQVTGTTFEVAPTAGCYFTASSTKANWQAVCRTSASAISQAETGVASSTNITGTGGWRRFRIEVDNDSAEFYIQASQTGNLIKVASLTSNIPTTTGLNAGLHIGTGATAPSANQLDFMRFQLWWRDFLPIV